MPESPLIAAGAQIQPINAAPLHTNEFFTGLWTQGNPLGPGAVPFLQQKFYSASRFERLVGGANVEVTTRLTLARRPGNSVYNSSLFPPINRFYCFRGFSAQGESIRIIASVDPATGSTQGTVRDVTGPSTNQILWTKDKNAGRTSFVSVGNILYAGDGVNTKMLVQSKRTWGVGTGGATTTIGTITNVQLYRARLSPPPSLIQTIAVFTLTAPPPVMVNGQEVDLAGLTTLTLLNNQHFNWGAALSGYVPVASNQIALNVSLFYSSAVGPPPVAETGTMTSPGAAFNTGEFIVDPNGNIQEAVGAQLANITNIQVDSYTVGGSPGRLVTVFLSSLTPLTISPGVHLQLTGLTTVPALNGTFYPVTNVENSGQVQFALSGTSIPITAYSAETGTAQTGSGLSSTIPPTWATTPGAVTIDGGQQWVCKGPAAMDWGFTGPATAPTVTQSQAPSLYGSWVADTWYAPLFVIKDGAGNLQQLTTGGTTGSSAPAFSATPGGTTTDGTAVWTCLGPSTWQASHAYTLNQVIAATYVYYITTVQFENVWNGYTFTPVAVSVQVPVSTTSLFQCVQAGTSGANEPDWINGLNTTTQDNSVGWKNMGPPKQWSDIGATQKVSTTATIVDANGYLEQIQTFGKSGSTAPTWKGQGETTGDTGSPPAIWYNAGPFTPAATAPWIYAYSGKSSVTGQVSTASPLSQPITPTVGNLVTVQGLGVPNPPCDLIVIWRTLAGGSTLFELDEIPNPGQGQPWTYTDTTPDLPAGGNPGLNQLIIAPIAGMNDPPPKAFVPQCYYLTRIFGFEGNILEYSNGPDQAGTAGSGDQSFSSKNKFTLPALGVKCWATTVGMIVFSNSDTYALLGQGTDLSPFYLVTFQEGVGLGNQDSFCVNGSTAYLMTTSGQLVSQDPGAGEVEVGFPIGDRFNQEFTPQQTYCAWHQGASADMALYVADGSTGWYRMAAVAAPEQGNVWSTKGLIQGGVKAIASLEIQPGLRGLLLGPSQQNQPILIRDRLTWQDNGVAYTGFGNFGVISLAQPGMTVGVEFVVTEEVTIAGATALTVSVNNDEITQVYLALRNVTKDPPNLPKSNSITAQRFWVAQDANTILPCRYFGEQIAWPAENFPNELLTNTIYGRMPEKGRR